MFNVSLSQLGSNTLLGVVVLLILLGYLVPVRMVRRIEKDRDEWKRAYFAVIGITRTKDHQLGEVLKTAETTRSVLEAIVPSPLESTPDEKTTV